MGGVRTWLAILAGALLAGASGAAAQEVPLIRLGHGFAAEEQLWLMVARPDLTPSQNKKYRLKFVQFQGNADRLQAYVAGELDGGTNPGITLIFAKAQGLDVKAVASLCLEAAGKEHFQTTYMVKEEGPVKTAADLKGGTVAVVAPKSATDLWARAGILRAGLVPDRDVKIVPMAFPAIGPAVRSDKVTMGTFVEPFYSSEKVKGGLRPIFNAVEAVGYDHELLDIWFSEKFLKAHGEAVRAFLADYVAATKYYVANRDQAKRDLVAKGFVRTPVEVYVKTADWKREPNGRIDVDSLKKLAVFMLEKLSWLEKPVNVDELVDQSYLPK